jgi:peptide deformylase
MAKKVKYYRNNLVEYEIYKLVDFYDPILRKPTKPIKLETLEDMQKAEYIMYSLSETLRLLGGLGLSANQVGLEYRVCSIDMGEDIWVMFNPEIIERSLVPQNEYSEGCLSYPGLYLKIPRAEKIKIRFQAVGGQFIEKEFSGLTAVCIQHELDHLDGIVYTDKVSPIKLDMAKKKVKQNLKKIKKITKVPPTPVEKPAEQPSAPVLGMAQPQEFRLQTTQQTPLELQEKPEKFVYKIG